MKKILSILFVLVPLVMQAQVDTLEFGDRDPTYYYWGDEWIDAVCKNMGVDYTRFYSITLSTTIVRSEETARCCFTKDTLKVIGVAVVARLCDSIRVSGGANGFVYPLDTTPIPEYCHIFKYNGPTEEETPMLAEARWENTEVRYMFYTGTWFGSFPVYYPLHEAYFDSAVYVCDTFYVSATANSNYKIKTDSVAYYYTDPDDTMYTYSWGYPHPPAIIYAGLYEAYRYSDVVVPPPFGYPMMKYKRQHLDHEINRWYLLDDEQDMGNYTYFYMFPIFDTLSWHDTTSLWCTAPNNLRAPAPDAESTVLLWNSTNGSEWDVSLCKECTEPDSGVITHYTTTFANLTGLEAGATYRAWVRAYCNESDTSYWSEELQFTVPLPADTGGTEQLFNVDDAYFVLTPNPASEMVNAFSSFQIGELDIYTMSGTLVRHESPRALSVNVDISDLPKGLYIVRATTAHGMAYARLVVV